MHICHITGFVSCKAVAVYRAHACHVLSKLGSETLHSAAATMGRLYTSTADNMVPRVCWMKGTKDWNSGTSAITGKRSGPDWWLAAYGPIQSGLQQERIGQLCWSFIHSDIAPWAKIWWTEQHLFYLSWPCYIGAPQQLGGSTSQYIPILFPGNPLSVDVTRPY